MVSILAGVDPAKGTDSFVGAAEAFEHAAESLTHDEGPWSIAELRLSDADINWLREWAHNLVAAQVEMNLQYASRSARIGLLFLSLAAETCRRDAPEDALWPTIRRLGWPDGVRQVLFTTQGAPRALLTQAIEAACNQYSLRNNLGEEGSQRWFTTIKLHFGLTHTGMREHLGTWLYLDTLPTAAQLLCHHDCQMYSQSFKNVIDGFDEFQRGYLPEHQLRARLLKSPWVLNAWIDDVVAAAGVRPSSSATMPRVRVDAVSSDTPQQPESEAEDVACVSEPRLVWTDSGEVEFVMAVRPELDELCHSDRFFVAIDDRNVAIFLRQTNGSYSRAGSDTRHVRVSTDRASVCVVAADGESESLAVQIVELFDSLAVIDAWDRERDGSFRKVDLETHQFQSTRGYTFRIPLEAVVEPEEAIACEDRHGHDRWIRLSPCWSANLRVTLDGVELFSRQAIHQDPAEKPEWVRWVGVTVFDEDWHAGHFRVRVSAREEIRILGLRVFGRPIDLNPGRGGTHESEPVAFDLNRPDGRVELRVAAIHADDRRVIRCSRNLVVVGLLRKETESWRLLPENVELNVGELRRGSYCVRPPETDELKMWVACEGHREVNVPMKVQGPIHDAAGWGQPLRLHEGRYNRPYNAQCIPLAARVVNRGCITSCVRISGSTSFVIQLQDPIELSQDHRIVVWTDEGHLAAIAPPDFSVASNDRLWQFDRERIGLGFAGEIVATAVAYRGIRIGSWWTDDWWRSMKELADTEEPEEAAARGRWFHLPLLDQRHAGAIQAMSETYGLDFAKAWLVWQDNLKNRQEMATNLINAKDHLRPPVADPAWYEVVRKLLGAWTPDADDAQDLAVSFEESARTFEVAANSAPLLNDMVDRVAEAAPLLLGRLVRKWLESQPEYSSHARPLLSALQELFRRKVDEQKRQQDSSLEFDPRLLPNLQLSDRFVDQLLKTANDCASGRTPDDHDLENLQQLIQYPSVSRLVASDLLETIAIA